MTDWNLITKTEEGKWSTVANAKPSDKGGYRIGVNWPRLSKALQSGEWGNFLLVEADKPSNNQEQHSQSTYLNDEAPF